MSRRIFLSYARRDAEPVAARLKNDLDRLGHTVYRDRENLMAGPTWDDQLSDAIRASEVFIALLSPLSVRNETGGGPAADDSVCRRELARALEFRIPIVPALVATCEIPLTLCGLHYQDFTSWRESEAFLAQAVAKLSNHIEDAAAGKVLRREGALPRMLDFNSFLEDRRRDFTGRQWLFARLEELLAGPARAVLITGPAGIGKSAIVAELVYRNPGNRVLAYHCCQWDRPRDTLDAGRFVTHLAGMLASRLDEFAVALAEELRIEPLVPDDVMGSLYRAILNPLSHLTRPPDAPRYFLIDALDESLAPDAGGADEAAPSSAGIVALVARFLPKLPDWLRVVATTRDDRRVLARLSALNGVELRAGDTLNLEDVASYVRRRLAAPPLADRSATVPDAQGKIVATTDGNFLVARTVLDALATNALPFDRIGRLAPGLPNIYLEFFERQFPTPASYRDAALVLGAAVVAEEPLDRAQLAAVTGLDSKSALRDALERLAAFMPLTAGRYALFHKSLADWVTADDERMGRPADRFHLEKAPFHRRFADMGWAEYERGPHAMSRYALLNLPNHLFRANRDNDRELENRLFRLLLDGKYLTARVAAEGPSLRSLINDYIDAEVGAFDTDHKLRPALEIVGHAVRLSAHAVTLDRTQLAGQLAGRLLGFDRPAIRATLAGALAYRGATWLRPLTASLVPAGGLLRWTFRGRPAGHKGTVRSIALSRNGYMALTAGNSHRDQTVKLWDLFQGELRWSWPEAAADGGRTALALLPGLAVASHENKLQVWSIDTGALLHSVEAHSARITALAPAGAETLLVSAAIDGSVCVWDPAHLPVKLRGFSAGAPVERLAVLDDKRLIVTQSDAGATCVFSFDTLVSVSDTEAQALFDPLAGNWSGYGRTVNPIALDPVGAHSVTVQDDGGLQIWRVKQRQVWDSLHAQGSPVSAAAVTADGRTAISAQFDHDLKVWDLTQYEANPAHPPHGHVDSIVLLPYDKVAVVEHRSSTGDPDTVVWDWNHAPPIELDPSTVNQRLIDDARDALYDSRADLDTIANEIDDGDPFPNMRLAAATPDCELAVFTTAPRHKGSDTEMHWLLHVWDVAAHAVIATLRGHHGMVFSASISEDGTRVASASEDGTVKLWRLPDGACLATFTGDSEMSAIAMTPEATLIAAGERSGRLHLLEVV